jgi:D-hexose-6-phosphate mutarotase
VIWLSPQAVFSAGKAIRGGIPVCWPWFGDHPSEAGFPAHGYARNTAWDVAETAALDTGATLLVLHLPENLSLWPHDSSAEIRLSIGETLEIELLTRNLGPDAFVLSQALHSYFKVAEVGRVEIQGLDGCAYIDKLDGLRKRQSGPVRIDGEVDRIYLWQGGDCLIDDPGMGRRIRVESQGSGSTIVWNPGIEKARQLADLGEANFRGMVCVETANAAEDAVNLAAGETHRLRAVYRVEKRV